MPITPVGIVSPDLPSPYEPVTDLAVMANTTDAAIQKVQQGANLFKGTQAQRAAALSTTTPGQQWQDTDGDRNRWVRGVSTWEVISAGDYRIGTSGQRASTAAKFGQIWQDSDGNKTKWKGRSNGSWTRLEGSRLVSAGAWDLTANGNSGRTLTLSLPCVLEANETLQITVNGVGSGFGILSLNTITKNASDTTVVLRHMQLFSSAQNSVGLSWQITDSPA